MSYRTPPMPSLVSYKAWDAGSSPEQDTTILHSPPMTYDSPPLTFSHDLTSEALVAEQTTTAITLDEHCYASPENLPNRDALKAARRVARRPNPVAIPNLTKKARGRPVPTKDTLLKPGSGRAYACPVQDCRKVFTRAEHLKRHTRSIHTNEKRKCMCCYSLMMFSRNNKHTLMTILRGNDMQHSNAKSSAVDDYSLVTIISFSISRITVALHPFEMSLRNMVH